VTRQAAQMTDVTKEQAKAVEDIVKGIENSREQVRQISAAVAEQAKQGQNIVAAVENVNKQAAQVAQAAREQTQGVEEIIKVWQCQGTGKTDFGSSKGTGKAGTKYCDCGGKCNQSGIAGNPGSQRAGSRSRTIIKGVVNAREQVKQVTAAVKEQALQGQIVIKAVENVTNQAAQVTQAVKNRRQELRKLSGTLQMRENRYARLLLRQRTSQAGTRHYCICPKCHRPGGTCVKCSKRADSRC